MKKVPSLLYGLEACPLNKAQVASLDFVVNRFFMKLFNTSNIEIVQTCQKFFGFTLTSVQLSKRAAKFENRLRETILRRRILLKLLLTLYL